MLLAGMGENYIRRHLFHGLSWFGKADRERLEKFKTNGVDLREYDPVTDVPDATPKNEQTGVSSGNLTPTDGASESSGNKSCASLPTLGQHRIRGGSGRL